MPLAFLRLAKVALASINNCNSFCFKDCSNPWLSCLIGRGLVTGCLVPNLSLFGKLYWAWCNWEFKSAVPLPLFDSKRLSLELTELALRFSYAQATAEAEGSSVELNIPSGTEFNLELVSRGTSYTVDDATRSTWYAVLLLLLVRPLPIY